MINNILKIIGVSIMVLVVYTIPGLADDSIYIKSGNQIIKEGSFKVIIQDPILSDLLLDNSSIYFYTSNFAYGVNSSSGVINYKIQVSDVQEQKLTDLYLFLMGSDKTVYKINKTSGIVEQKTLYNTQINNIYSLLDILRTSGNGTGIKGDKGDPGEPGINGTSIKGDKGDQGDPGQNGTNGINQSDITKINKSGDTVADAFSLSNSGSIDFYAGNDHLALNDINLEHGINYNYGDRGVFSYDIFSDSFNILSRARFNWGFSTLDNIDLNGNYLLNCGNCLTDATINKTLSGYNNDLGFVTNTTVAHDVLKLNKTGDEALINHNNLSGKQGGIAGQYNHLSNASFNVINNMPECYGIGGFYNVLNYNGSRIGCTFIAYDNLTWENGKVSKSGDTMTGRLIQSRNNKILAGYATFDAGSDRTIGLITVNRLFNEATSAYESGDKGSATGMGMGMDSLTPQVSYFSFLANSNSYSYWYQSNPTTTTFLTGNLKISQAGKGITLYSPNNSPFCMTVSNTGVLTTVSGACI